MRSWKARGADTNPVNNVPRTHGNKFVFSEDTAREAWLCDGLHLVFPAAFLLPPLILASVLQPVSTAVALVLSGVAFHIPDPFPFLCSACAPEPPQNQLLAAAFPILVCPGGLWDLPRSLCSSGLLLTCQEAKHHRRVPGSLKPLFETNFEVHDIFPCRSSQFILNDCREDKDRRFGLV